LRRLQLPNVMLCAVTSIALPETLEAFKRCLEQVEFGSALLLTDQPSLASGHPEIHCRTIDPIRSQQEYSEFILRKLNHYVDFDHVLLVQWDSFILDASCWRADFLRYDYIGALWPQFDDDCNVGNGGFSLRSKRLLQLTASAQFPGSHPEDVSICRTHRAWLESRGTVFAPPSVAEQFSFERSPPAKTFGFHGLFNFPQVLPRDKLAEFLERIDERLLKGRDGTDLILGLPRLGMGTTAWRLAMRRRPQNPFSRTELHFWLRLVRATLKSALD
jgi:hypothetical protein